MMQSDTDIDTASDRFEELIKLDMKSMKCNRSQLAMLSDGLSVLTVY